MLLRITLPIFAVALGLGGAGCKKETTNAEKQAQKVKDFRAAQKQKAIRAYHDLTVKYPDSEFAPQAKEKLQQLGPPAPATPAPKKK